MDILSIIFLAIGLAMDCFAVSIAQGMQRTPIRSVIPMAILFGLFQGGMPLIAYYAGGVFADFFTRWSHWIALVLLVLIGGKMLIEAIVESRKSKVESDQKSEVRSQKSDVRSQTALTLSTMLILAVATSIDALSIGVLFIPVPDVLWLAISLIAATSTLFSLVGFWLGKIFGEHITINANIPGGCILIAIGIKIFLEGILG
jgi:putative Mn2+ efflux pump MntP